MPTNFPIIFTPTLPSNPASTPRHSQPQHSHFKHRQSRNSQPQYPHHFRHRQSHHAHIQNLFIPTPRHAQHRHSRHTQLPVMPGLTGHLFKIRFPVKPGMTEMPTGNDNEHQAEIYEKVKPGRTGRTGRTMKIWSEMTKMSKARLTNDSERH